LLNLPKIVQPKTNKAPRIGVWLFDGLDKGQHQCRLALMQESLDPGMHAWLRAGLGMEKARRRLPVLLYAAVVENRHGFCAAAGCSLIQGSCACKFVQFVSSHNAEPISKPHDLAGRLHFFHTNCCIRQGILHFSRQLCRTALTA
jgi:hypothetical protein